MNKVDLPETFYELPKDRQRFLLSWISNNLRPIESINTRYTSYSIKHWIEEEYPNEYFTNGELKGAMLEANYRTNNENALNWCFNISERSPIIVKRKAQMK
ncbi:hypothetical protein [uncultured Ruminococcus sp.]|uniref:hypothetical protein n=1 Tax=uncultured Ruminococcus sp. TaxID=165186 RepID=UPI0026DDB29E|nr:hypothetical protein [uncultured Ruminococcus sp.]